MRTRFFAIAGLVVALGVAPMAQAHTPNGSADCDTWTRTSGGEGGSGHGNPSHHDTSSSDIDNVNDVIFLVNQPTPVYVHRETGHYVVRDNNGANMSYVEVGGGGQFTGDNTLPNAGEGGFVQGRVSAGGQNEVDYSMDFFGPIREPAPQYLWATTGQACVSVGTTKIPTGRVYVTCQPGQASNPAQNPAGLCHY